MAIETAHQLAVTQEKLRGLEEHLQNGLKKTAADDRAAQLSLRSIAHMINQLKKNPQMFKLRPYNTRTASVAVHALLWQRAIRIRFQRRELGWKPRNVAANGDSRCLFR